MAVIDSDRIVQTQMITRETETLVNYWNKRDAQMREDRDVINLIKPIPTSDKLRWTSNEPKVFFDTSRSLVSIYPPRFRLPMTINFTPDEKQKMNKAERLLIGIYRTLDKRATDVGGVSWLWDLAYWVLLGWYSVFVMVVDDEEEGLKFLADIWDPITVYPRWDGIKLVRCVRTFEVDKITAISMATEFMQRGLEFDFSEPKAEEMVKVVNFWSNDNGKIQNAIMLGGQLVKPLTHQAKLKRIPIHIGAVGSPDRTMPLWETRRGEPITAANQDMYKYKNYMISLMATILSETAYPNIITKSRTGQPLIKPGTQLRGYGDVASIKLEDSIELLKHAATPTEANILMSFVAQQEQKGALPASVYGSLPFELSGFAISQLMAAIKYKLGPYLNAMQSIVSGICSDFLYQYKIGKFKKLTLSTLNPYDLKRGMTYIEEFTSEDVPENIFVEVTIPITSQFDKTQAILNARQALTPPQIFSRETLWETELDVQDTEQEYERIRQDQVMEDPFVRQIEIIEKMWERVEVYNQQGNKIMADALKRYIMGLEVQLGMRQAIPVTGKEPGGAVKPFGGTSAPGIPPNQRPPEMMGTESPDMLRAVTNISPPGLKRRPQSPEERVQSKTGAIVSPSGEALL